MSTVVKLYERKTPQDRIILSQTGIHQFEVGMQIDVEYLNPKEGKMLIWLENNDDNVVLSFSVYMNPRVLVLNTKQGGEWGTFISICGYDYTAGASQHVSFDAEKDYFIIRVNDKDLYHYDHMLPPNSIHKVLVQYDPIDGAAAPKFKGVSYKSP